MKEIFLAIQKYFQIICGGKAAMDLTDFINDVNNINSSLFIKKYCDDVPDSLTEHELVRLYSKELGLEKLVSSDWISDAKSGRHLIYLIRDPKNKTDFHVFTEERGLALDVKTFGDLAEAAEKYFRYILFVLRFSKSPKAKNTTS